VPTALALGWCYKRLGRLADAVESLEHAVVIDPNLGIAHYNLACYLALIGRTKLALRHLGAAVELDGDFRDRAAHESDFDSIRNDPEFQAVISVVV
jgi:tetratricopeptide (TPR) repeat protein